MTITPSVCFVTLQAQDRLNVGRDNDKHATVKLEHRMLAKATAGNDKCLTQILKPDAFYCFAHFNLTSFSGLKRREC